MVSQIGTDRVRTVLDALPELRVVPIEGDSMDPTLYDGDAVGAVPVDGYIGEGVYVIDNQGVLTVYRVQTDMCSPGQLLLLKDNKKAGRLEMSKVEFSEIVVGRVLVLMKMIALAPAQA